MTRIPPAALLLSIAGLAPFVLGAVMASGMISAAIGAQDAGGYAMFIGNDGRLIMVRYGVIILCFMAGVQWGFATKASGAQATACYFLSVLPALWAFLNPGRGAEEALINLLIGFIAVLLVDFAFSRWRLTPDWWMSLRIPITVVVLACISVGIWA